MITTTHKPVVCFVTGSAGDRGGASRVLFTNIRQLDRSLTEPQLLPHDHGVNETEPPTYKIARFAQGRSRREEFGITPGRVVVSFICQMREIKGVQDFIAAARSIGDPELVFLMAGRCRNPDTISGAYTEADLETMIGGDTRIRYLGYIERVEDIYETSDIIVVPSRKPEPLGRIALEAGALGKPVIATRVGGLPEIVEDSVTGYLVDPASPQALQEAIVRLAGNAPMRKRLGESGRNQVTSQFTRQPNDAFQNLLLALAKKNQRTPQPAPMNPPSAETTTRIDIQALRGLAAPPKRSLEEHMVVGAPEDCTIDQREYKAMRADILAALSEIEQTADVPIICFDSLLCDGHKRRTRLGGTLIYRDSGHLSYDTSRELATSIHLVQIAQNLAR